jgi:DNA segregation ATPase FtsK/SpoIIIE, S-DNA-T family
MPSKNTRTAETKKNSRARPAKEPAPKPAIRLPFQRRAPEPEAARKPKNSEPNKNARRAGDASTPEAVPSSEQAKAVMDSLLRFITRFERFWADIAGIVVLALAGMTLLALLAPSITRGFLLRGWANLLLKAFGLGSVWVAAGGVALGIWLLLRRRRESDVLEDHEPLEINWGRVVAVEAAAFASMALLAAAGGGSLDRAASGLDGGQVGWGLLELGRLLFGGLGLTSLLWPALLYGVIFLLGLLGAAGAFAPLRRWARAGQAAPAPPLHVEQYENGSSPAVVEAPLPGAEGSTGRSADLRRKKPFLPAEFRKNFRIETAEEEPVGPPAPRDERLPPLTILAAEQSSRQDERHINLTAGLIEKTLSEFGIPAKVVGFRVGPTVTQFAVEPGFLEKEKPGTEGALKQQKVRVAQISALNRDLALALSAERLRIEAPVPGRPYVGIEVPNARSTIVRLRPILESENFTKTGAPLAIGLGRDVSGQPVVADLARMPHLLIAGTTGSGKSVCIAALTACLAMNNTPEDLHIVMIDPKMVELVRFNGLPHLLGKVETDLERILAVLRWVVAEMDRRYKVLEASHSRNLDSHNKKARKRKGDEYLPRMVVMIDELADLMMSAPDQTEHTLVRLAQLARATGIHLIVATQRPSTDVVTGLIKANFPARIAFAVASSIDSRVILDTQGAESLLGHGDMLFLQPEAAAPMRAQGAMITDTEIERMITYWQKTLPGASGEASPWDQMIEEEATLADRDDLVQKAIKIVQESQRASASMLQRKLKIGYPRAARLIDELEELGVVGPNQGGGREREVLASRDDDFSQDVPRAGDDEDLPPWE